MTLIWRAPERRMSPISHGAELPKHRRRRAACLFPFALITPPKDEQEREQAHHDMHNDVVAASSRIHRIAPALCNKPHTHACTCVSCVYERVNLNATFWISFVAAGCAFGWRFRSSSSRAPTLLLLACSVSDILVWLRSFMREVHARRRHIPACCRAELERDY